MENLGGAELRTIQMANILGQVSDVSIWATRDIDPRLTGRANITRINAQILQYPKNGVFVFIGCYQPIGDWIRRSEPSRVILLHNTPTFNLFKSAYEKLLSVFENVEIVYTSEWLKIATGFPGEVQASPIDVKKFPSKLNYDFTQNFRVGRLSRDDIQKHDPNDCELYVELANSNCTVDIMGGKTLQKWLPNHNNIFLSDSGDRDSSSFLRDLDVFYYKTNPNWREPFGRVILEAMLTGLPVVAHMEGGYAENIEHGLDGFLFRDQSEALSIILELKGNASIRKSVGESARRKALSIYGDNFINSLIKYYTHKPIYF